MKNIENLTKVTKLAALIKESNKIAVLTGAGISTDSGIPDFRSTSDSIWVKNRSREELMSESHFNSKPKEFWPAYKDIFKTKLMGQFLPNYGHVCIKELEDMGKQVSVITQNVDGLHKDAGNTDIYEIHGSIKSATCPKCKRSFGLIHINKNDIPRCDRLLNAREDYCNFILKPDVVLFGGSVKQYLEAEKKVNESDLVLILGTSLQVSPFNLLPLSAGVETKVAIVNLESTELDRMLDIVIHDSISDTLKSVKTMLEDEE